MKRSCQPTHRLIGNLAREMMASAEFSELHIVSVFPQRAHEDATRRSNRQDIIGFAVGNINKRHFHAVGPRSSTRLGPNDKARRKCDDVAEYVAIGQAK